MTSRSATPSALTRMNRAMRAVRAKYPSAFGWREFTVSDYEVKSEPGGKRLAKAATAADAWELAAKEIS